MSFLCSVCKKASNPSEVVELTRASARCFQVKAKTVDEAIGAVARAIPQGDAHPFSNELDDLKACYPVSVGIQDFGVWNIIVEYKYEEHLT